MYCGIILIVIATEFYGLYIIFSVIYCLNIVSNISVNYLHIFEVKETYHHHHRH